MAKRIIRLTEGDLHKIIKKSINEILTDPYDYAKVRGLSAAAYGAAKTPGADPKWAERKMRQSALIKDRANKLANEYSDMEGNNPNVDWAMAGQGNHRVQQGLDDPKGYIKRNGYGDFLKGVKESKLNRIVKESVKKIIKENELGIDGFEDELPIDGEVNIDDFDDEWPEERIEDRIDTEANMDDFPPTY